VPSLIAKGRYTWTLIGILVRSVFGRIPEAVDVVAPPVRGKAQMPEQMVEGAVLEHRDDDRVEVRDAHGSRLHG
jgi:hypothetical protein